MTSARVEPGADAFAIAPVGVDALDEIAALLGRACAFDRAAAVAREKLWGPGPDPARGDARVWAARVGGAIVGVAAACDRWLRLLAIDPSARGRGVGSALLVTVEESLRAGGVTRARVIDQPGNYLAPGIDARNEDAIAWLERRGWRRGATLNCDLHVAVRGNPRVDATTANASAARAAARGYLVRRATLDEGAALGDAIAREFGGAWPFEIARALARSPAGVHVAIDRAGAYAAFAAHDGNNAGLGWFGPTGTWPAHRGQGLGEALLLACLVDVAVDHDVCEVAWIGPREFYDRVAGIVGERRFVTMTKELGAAPGDGDR